MGILLTASETSVSQFDRAKERLCLIHSLLIFTFGDRVSNYSGAGLDTCFAVIHDNCANRDARIQIIGVIGVKNRSGVNAAVRGFELAYDLHGSNFWRAGHSARGKARSQRVKAIQSIAQ